MGPRWGRCKIKKTCKFLLAAGLYAIGNFLPVSIPEPQYNFIPSLFLLFEKTSTNASEINESNIFIEITLSLRLA